MIVKLKEYMQSEKVQKIISFLEEKHVRYTFFENEKVFLIFEGETIMFDDVFDGCRIYSSDSIGFFTSREFFKDDIVVDVNGIKIGGNNAPVFVGGPCSIENESSSMELAKNIKLAGGNIFRGGTYKPRTSPYSFQGLKSEGLNIMNNIRNDYKIPVVSEILSIENIDEFVKNVDIIQVGARNMQNYPLLTALGKIDKPIILKRGIASTIEEWLAAAEYILAGGNRNVILCERGIRTYGKETRYTLDLSSIPYIKKYTPLPIIVDPSHATGRREFVKSMSLAAIAAGADGLLIEVHQCPSLALSDKDQCISVEEFEDIVKKCNQIIDALNKGND